MERMNMAIDQPKSRSGSEASEPLADVIRQLGDSLKQIVKSEIHLAKAEVKVTGKHLGKEISQVMIFAVVALAGILPLMAFCVIGLGELIGNYWLSSLIVSLVFIGVGGGLAYRAYSKMKRENLTLNQTRHMADEEIKLAERKVREITSSTKRRATL
jgi:hypothetical protein